LAEARVKSQEKAVDDSLQLQVANLQELLVNYEVKLKEEEDKCQLLESSLQMEKEKCTALSQSLNTRNSIPMSYTRSCELSAVHDNEATLAKLFWRSKFNC